MENKTSTGKYWILFLLSLVLIIIMLISPDVRPYFWLALPLVCTFFVKALDVI
ncbi:hypothetical protein [Hydrotalea sp.]|uniref:hypothetical protein n=1 Tax=Hydrotalea sp. TaxID=2881279 RepID=UPI002605851F|nr:hypothetical protein [Hydrotalea sp.]